jgi:hypothetical protein
LSLFLARGYSRDKYLQQIIDQDGDYDLDNLDLAQQQANEEAVKFSSDFMKFLSKFNFTPR